MDRIRESRRGGGGSGAVSGHASSRRRPRSGFKDSSVACEEDEGLNESHDSTRLRSSNNNNNKKERSSLSSSRNKRKRPGLQERFHGSNSRDRERERENDGADDSSEDSGGDEDEDDDDEPPRPANPTKTTKFKSQWKVSEEIFAPVLGSFPRKARSASVKRVHDSSSVLVAAGSDGPVHRQPSPSPARPSVIPASPSSSNVSVKPGKRMKPIGTKPRPSKMAKVSISISEKEVEVAEVLYGLTRHIHSHHSPAESYPNASKPDVKESSNDASVPVLSKVASPMPASSVVSSPISTPISPPPSSPALTVPQHSSSNQAPAVAPKRKRPRPAKPEETTPAIAMRPPVASGGTSATSASANVASGIKIEVEPASQTMKMEVSSSKPESHAAFPVGLIKGIPSVPSTTSASSICVNSNPVSTLPVLSAQSNTPTISEQIVATKIADLKSISSEKIVGPKFADLKSISSEKAVGFKIADSKSITSEKIGGAKIADLKSITTEKTGATSADSKSVLPIEKKPSAAAEEVEKVVSEVSEAPVDQIATKETDTSTNDLPSSGPDEKVETVKMLPQSPKKENTSEEKFKIDLMAPPAKSSLDIENDSRPDAVGNVASELPEKGTVENASASEVKTAAVKKEKEPEKREEEVKVEQTEKKHDKIDNAEEKGLEKRHVKERDIDLQMEGETLEKDSSKQHLQKQSKIPKNESRTQKPERPVSAPIEAGNVSSSVSAVASLPVPMTVPSWPGGLHPLGYFGPAGANWPGAPSLQGVISMEGTNTTPTIQPAYIMQQSRQTWKRCATHSYIAHFIKCQQQMARNPFWAAANYGSSVALFGAKPYNLNMPLPPPSESINLVGSLSGTVSASSVGNGGSSSRNLGSLQERNIGSPALAAFNSQNSKEKASTSYMDVRRKQPLHQQVPQQTTSTIMQHGPTFGFPLTQSGVGGANSSAASNTGNAGPSLNVGNPGLGTVPSSGTGAANSSFASMASQDAPYLAMFPQSYPFAISHAHFGATYNGAPNHIGQQQAAQFFNGSFYAAQMLHPPPPQPQPQQQGPQNPSTSSGSSSSQKHQHQHQQHQQQQQLQSSRNFPSSQKQPQQQGTPSPSPSNSQQQHLPAPQTRQIEREASNGGDSPSTADSRLPMLQKSFYSQGSPSNPNFTGVPIHPQDLALMAALGGKHNSKQQQQPPTPIGHLQHQAASYTVQQHHGNDPALQMSLLSQSQAQAIAALSQSSGALGFSPIAQGHAMIQGIPESARIQPQLATQAQQNALQSGPQSQRSGQVQRAHTSSVEGRNGTDAVSHSSGRGREDDRKMSIKGGLGPSLNFSRIENESSANMQGSSTDGGLSTSSLVTNSIDSMGRTLNMIASPSNGIRNSRSTGSPSQGNSQPPSAQQLSQSAKHAMGRAKPGVNANVPTPVVSVQATSSSYGDRAAVASNITKFQASSSSFPGQNLKQGQQSPQWKLASRTVVPSTMPAAGAAPTQAVFAAAMKSFPQQQGRNQQGNSNLGSSSPSAPPQAAFVASTKNSGQPPLNQQNNPSSAAAPRLPLANATPASVVGSLPVSPPSAISKSMGSSALRTATGSKGPISQQKSIAPISNKKSSPVGGRSMPSVLGPSHISQSSSGKSSQQLQQQSVSPMGSVQPVGLKNQQYHNNQAHFNPQLLFSHNQYMQQQAVQQSQFSSQSAHQMAGFHQKQQMHGSNSPQPSFSNPHLRQQQEQQQQASSTSSNAGTLSLGPPTLTLGGASCGPAKIMPGGSLGANSKGNMVLHAQYSPLNSLVPSQQQSGSPHASLSSQYMQAATNLSAKSAEQKAVSEGLNQDQINGVRLLPNSVNLCTSSVQTRTHFNASSPQASSIRMPAGNLKKTGGNTVDNMTSPGNLSLSMVPSSGIRTNNSGLASSGNATQHAKSVSVSSTAAVHSGQIPTISMHQPPVSLAAGPISPASSTPSGLHGKATASVVQP